MPDDRADLTVPLALLAVGLGLLGAVALFSNRRVRLALAEASAEARLRDRQLREEFGVPTVAEGVRHWRRLQTNLAKRVQN